DYIIFFQPFLPEIQASRRHGISDFRDLLGATSPLSYAVAPGKEGENRPRRSHFVAKIEVIRFRIVEVYRLFNQSKTENTGIKIIVSPGIACNGSKVMYP